MPTVTPCQCVCNPMSCSEPDLLTLNRPLVLPGSIQNRPNESVKFKEAFKKSLFHYRHEVLKHSEEMNDYTFSIGGCNHYTIPPVYVIRNGYWTLRSGHTLSISSVLESMSSFNGNCLNSVQALLKVGSLLRRLSHGWPQFREHTNETSKFFWFKSNRDGITTDLHSEFGGQLHRRELESVNKSS